MYKDKWPTPPPTTTFYHYQYQRRTKSKTKAQSGLYHPVHIGCKSFLLVQATFKGIC